MANIDGTSAGETLVGTSDADVIRGFGGNDVLNGLEGADRLEGGTGDDAYFVDNAADVIVELLGEGFDAVYTSVSYVLTAGADVEWLSTISTAATTAINLSGNERGNTLLGNAGANILNGAGGADAMIGYGGDDLYFVDAAGDGVVEAAGAGNDTIRSSVSYFLSAGVSVETLAAISQTSLGDLSLTGNELAQTLLGNNGFNVLNGNGGGDVMIGYGGSDSYYIRSAGDQVVEAAGQGFDAVYTAFDYTLAAGVEVEWFSTIDNAATAPLNLTGNEFNQYLIGNAGANVLNGGGGVDLMYGLGGDDIYIIDNAGDVPVESANGGNDTVRTSVSYLLSADIQVEKLETTDAAGAGAIDLIGNNIAQELIGNAGANSLNGAGGADVMRGLGGNDIYYVDSSADQVIEAAGQGFDTIYTEASFALAAGSEVEWLAAAAQASTTALNLTGNAFVNYLLGNDGANIIDGGAGSDIITGYGGADTFAFTTALGAANVDTINDFVAGTDKIGLGGAAGQPFVALATGSLRAGTFVIGAAALDADDYLIYNSATGALLYDADGNGAGAAVQFATLGTGLGLTAADFIVTGTANTAPAITSGATASIAENSNVGTVVYQVAANDADGDRITYSLSGADAGLLTIDANGAVRLITPADFETKPTYSFNVVASDSGTSTTRAVTLTITDVNEGGGNTPIINETAGPNNSRQNAQVIDPGTFAVASNPNLYDDDLPSATIVGSISSLTDQDFFAITLQAGQQLILDVDGTDGLDAFLSLFRSDGTLIGENDDLITPDPGSNPPFPHNTDSQIIFRAATSGTYYFSIKSFADDQGPTSQGAYSINVSINNVPATPAQIMAEDVNALVSGAAWNHTNLTYGFPSSPTAYPQDFEEVDTTSPDPVYTFEAFSAGQQNATRALLQMIANATQLTFTELTGTGNYLTGGSAASADLRFAESSAADVAYAYYPNNGGPDDVGGTAWFNRTNFNTPIKGNYAWMGILHETGHALGLKHGHEFPLAISADHDSVEYSVMTYRSYPGGDVEGGYSNETFGYPQTLMMLDIAALQQIYDGANYTYNNTNSVYTWSDVNGEMSINGVGQGAPGSNRIFMTIWDGGGIDTYDLSNYADNLTIDLRPGEWTNTNATQTAGLGDGNFARGNIANALLFEGNTASAIENAKGGIGADTLIANLVANQFTGNSGADTFKWMATGDAGTGALADTVLDFVRGTDKLDFSNLDANPALAGQQDFGFIGTAAFTNVAGQVRYEVTGGSAHIFADVDGNGGADMEIILTNVITLAGTDFNF